MTELLMRDSVSNTGSSGLDALIAYHFEGKGARTRARLALLSAHALGLPDHTATRLAATVELIHNASLLHDDVQDGDEQRRSRPSAWKQFDVNTALCAGTLLLSAAYRVCSSVPSHAAELVSHCHQRTTQLIAGQVRDLEAVTCPPTLDDYLEIAIGKSGSLMALPLELSLIAAREQASLPQAMVAGHAFAVAYQMLDDIADIDVDAQRGQNNIVSVLSADGSEQFVAIERARSMLREHLARAIVNARWLPAGSGDVLHDLCLQLQRSVLTPPSGLRHVA